MSISRHHFCTDWEFFHAIFRYYVRYSVNCVRYVMYLPRKLWRKKMISPPFAHITQIGDPVLRSNAEYVQSDYLHTESTANIIALMVQCIRRYGLSGVSAPQIGVPLRIIVMEFTEKAKRRFSEGQIEERQMSVMPLTVFINPEMQLTSKIINEFDETCSSLCGYAATVPRHDSCIIRGIGKMGTPKTVKLIGWNARIAQHQMDHLDGKFFIDRMNTSTFFCLMWKEINLNSGKGEIKYNEVL